MIPYRASPPLHKSSCLFLSLSSCKRVIYNPGQPHDQFQAQPHKHSYQQYWGKRGRQGEKYIKGGMREEFLKPTWQPKPPVSPSCVVGRTWERIWGSPLCSWLPKRKGLAFSYWSRGSIPLVATGSCPYLLTLLFSASSAWGPDGTCHSHQLCP